MSVVTFRSTITSTNIYLGQPVEVHRGEERVAVHLGQSAADYRAGKAGDDSG
jgi:hypothetical protein